MTTASIVPAELKTPLFLFLEDKKKKRDLLFADDRMNSSGVHAWLQWILLSVFSLKVGVPLVTSTGLPVFFYTTDLLHLYSCYSPDAEEQSFIAKGSLSTKPVLGLKGQDNGVESSAVTLHFGHKNGQTDIHVCSAEIMSGKEKYKF